MVVGGVVVSAWVAWLVFGLALCGLWAACWAACWTVAAWLEWARDWWRDRRELSDEEEGALADLLQANLELPPERTWEQMTSHQLPVVDPPPLFRPLIDKGLYRWAPYEAERERRAPAWEYEHRAHYVAMGLDYPSGLVARVREAAQ